MKYDQAIAKANITYDVKTLLTRLTKSKSIREDSLKKMLENIPIPEEIQGEFLVVIAPEFSALKLKRLNFLEKIKYRKLDAVDAELALDMSMMDYLLKVKEDGQRIMPTADVRDGKGILFEGTKLDFSILPMLY